MKGSPRKRVGAEAVVAGKNATDLERFAGYAPALIVIYFACQLAVRLLLSSNLEMDEASFVGATHWAWGYGDSQPPLYNWLVIIVVGVFRYWPAIAIIKYALLAATFLFVYDGARRAGGSRVIGATAAFSLAFVYQIIWQSQFTLAHSVLSVAAAAATFHACVLILERGRVRNFVWLGVAVSAGVLSKYNYALVLVSLGFAIGSVGELRRAFWRPATLLALGLALIAFCPHALWAIAHSEVTTARLARLDEGSVFSRLGLPIRGVGGLLSLLWAMGSAVAPMILCRMLSERNWGSQLYASAENVRPSWQEAARQMCGRTVGIAMLLCVLAIVLADFHSVLERYVTPLTVPFSLWLSWAWPMPGRRRALALYSGLAATVAIGVALALPIPTLFGTHIFAFPYGAMATDLSRFANPPFAVYASRREHAANIAIRIPGVTIFNSADLPEKLVVLSAESEGPEPEYLPPELETKYSPVGSVADSAIRMPTSPERMPPSARRFGFENRECSALLAPG